MDNRRLNLGVVASLRAESFGEPGRRTFRILAATAEGQVSLWLEKEQLAMVGSAIEEVLRRTPSSTGETPESEPGQKFTGELEVRVGSLTIGYDAEHAGFTVEASDFESAFDLTGIDFLARRSDFARMEEEIEVIVAAGRPRCPVCGTPLSGGPHFCPPSNGHAHLNTPG